MARVKKIVIPGVIVSLLILGGIFYWQNQQDVRELNESLPEGVRVVKSSTGEYRVVSKIDGYEFRVPERWRGIKKINYLPERTEAEYTGSSIELEGKRGGSRIVSIDRFKVEQLESNLIAWARTFFETFGLVGDFEEDKIGEFEVVKTQEEIHLVGMYVYFFKKNSVIYTITCGSEEFIQEIIVSGEW